MSYQVRLEPSGHTFDVANGKTVLKAAMDAGLLMPYSCRAGGCATCRGKIVEGTVDYGPIIPGVLPDSDRKAGYALMCVAKPLSDLVVELRELEGVTSVKPQTFPCRVVGIERAAPDVAVLRLRIPMNYNIYFMPGQYLEVLLKDGQRRTYSIAVAPHHEDLTHLELHIRHSPGGLFTDYVFESLKQNEMLRFEGPFGTFFLREDSDKPIVLLAGGTGFAPIKSIIEYTIRQGIRRPIHLYWGGRTRRDIYMMDLAKQWQEQHEHIKFVPVLSSATPECNWEGRRGFVHHAVMEDFPDLSGYQLYACGTPAMVNAAKKDFVEQRALPDNEFIADSFV
jgi:CDP-4-dehydro-6-deoxyglucose reductase